MCISIHINRNFIDIIIFTIMNSIMTYIEKNLDIIKEADFFSNLFSDISNIFLIIFYFIEKYRSKLKAKEENLIKLEKKQEQQKNVSLIFSSLIFKFIYNYNIIKFDNKIKDIDIFIILILFLMLLEIFIFNKNIYSHQIISMSMIFIILLYYQISNIINSNYKLSYFLFILSSYSLSFNYLLIKYINTDYFINIYFLATIHGLSGTIQFFVQKYKKIIILLYTFDGLKKILMIILYLIMMIINNFLLFKIIFKLNPFHPLMIDYITTFIIEKIIYDEKKNEKFKFKYFHFILLLLILILCLIYLEIITLNFFFFIKNIKENIIQRGEYEIAKELISDSETDSND